MMPLSHQGKIWMQDTSSQLCGRFDTGCVTHSEDHRTMMLPVTLMGSNREVLIEIYDAYRYIDTPGYCVGDDDVSRTLIKRQVWERRNTEVFLSLLGRYEGVVVDIGAHVGWFTLHALNLGRRVLAVEAQDETGGLLAHNAQRLLGGLAYGLYHSRGWIDERTSVLAPLNCPEIAVMKIDIEGNERFAISAFSRVIEEGHVHSLIVECSPVFNDSYPELVGWLQGQGYTAKRIDDGTTVPVEKLAREGYINSFHQADLVFER